jgi:subtilisin family serine protease
MVAIAPDALIMPLRAFDDTGAGDAFQVAKAIRYAAMNGANVINLSLGLSDNASEVRAAIDFAISRGVIVVASVGNAGSAMAQYPAALPNVLGVGSTDLDDLKATFSNYGSDTFVTAPGVNIVTAYPGGYATVSGTSFSTAFVSAEAALILALRSNGVADAIAGSAVNIDGLNPSYAGQLGYGRINLLAAVTFLAQTATTQTPASRDASRYIVRFVPGTGKADREAHAKGAGANVKFNFDIVDAISVSVPSQAAANKLANNPNVIEVVPDLPVFALGGAGSGGTSSSQVVPSGVTRLGLPTSMARTLRVWCQRSTIRLASLA